MKRLIVIAAALIVVVNGWILISVAYNRVAGEPQLLMLNERELRLPRQTSNEESIVQFTLQFLGNNVNDTYFAYNRSSLLPQESLERLGFNASGCDKTPSVQRFGESVDGWVLLEFDGLAYQNLLQDYQSNIAELKKSATQDATEKVIKRLERLEKNYQQVSQNGSRLVVVDAAIERADLLNTAKTYDAATLILQASIKPKFQCKKRLVNIYLNHAQHLYIPTSERHVVAGLTPMSWHVNDDKIIGPRYIAQVGVGTKGYWWLNTLNSCDGKCE